jgi:lysophospholipase L1-like esterase
LTIKKLRDAYPNAIIYCATLSVFKRVTYDRFPTRNGRNTLPEFNDAIRQIANTMGCGLIEFDKDGITFENCYAQGYIDDNADHPTHPSAKGQSVMANKALQDLKYYIRGNVWYYNE